MSNLPELHDTLNKLTALAQSLANSHEMLLALASEEAAGSEQTTTKPFWPGVDFANSLDLTAQLFAQHEEPKIPECENFDNEPFLVQLRGKSGRVYSVQLAKGEVLAVEDAVLSGDSIS